MLDSVMRFIIGILISLGFGWLITSLAYEYFGYHIRKKLAAADYDKFCVQTEHARIFGSHLLVTGTIERFVFTLMVAYDVSGSAVAMMAWLGLKLAISWNKNMKTFLGKVSAFYFLFTGIVSLLFALAGGLFIRVGIP